MLGQNTDSCYFLASGENNNNIKTMFVPFQRNLLINDMSFGMVNESAQPQEPHFL